MKYRYLIALVLVSGCSDPSINSCAGLNAVEAWVREMPPGPQVTAGYMLLSNSSEQDIKVTDYSSPDFARIELHESRQVNGQMQMRKLEALKVPATESLALQPGGWHLMLFEPARPVTAGQTLTLNLHCGQDTLSTAAEVRKAKPNHYEHHDHH